MGPPPRAVVVVTGSELVRGDRGDANGPFLARELTALGLEPARIVTVGDRLAELQQALREGLAADACLVSGGLGPTHDDRTIELLAAVSGRRLVVDEQLAREVEARSRAAAERLHREYAEFTAGIGKQASVPEGGEVLGLAGTAPAVLLELDGRVAVALPGPPSELRALWPRVVGHPAFARLLARSRPPHRRVLRVFGQSEAAVARALAEAGGPGEGVEVTVCARDLEVAVDFVAASHAEERAQALARALRERFREQVFAEDDRAVEELVVAICRERGLALATAESCTGGLVGARVTAVPGASDVYVGGVVAYSDEVKRRELGVPEEVLARHGAVSAETARAMAAGVRRALASDVGVAVTGIAGPGGGTTEKPVGLVFLTASFHGGELEWSGVLPGDREDVRRRATVAALHLVRRLLSQPVTHA